MTLDHQYYFRNGFWRSELYGKEVLLNFLCILVQELHFPLLKYANYMLISYYANKKSSPRLPSWQPSLISFNTPIDSGSIIKPCTLKHFQVTILAPGLHWETQHTGHTQPDRQAHRRTQQTRHTDTDSLNSRDSDTDGHPHREDRQIGQPVQHRQTHIYTFVGRC